MAVATSAAAVRPAALIATVYTVSQTSCASAPVAAEDESGTMADDEDDAEDSMVTHSTTATAQALKMLATGCGSFAISGACHIRCGARDLGVSAPDLAPLLPIRCTTPYVAVAISGECYIRCQVSAPDLGLPYPVRRTGYGLYPVNSRWCVVSHITPTQLYLQL